VVNGGEVIQTFLTPAAWRKTRITTRYLNGGIHMCDYGSSRTPLKFVMCANQEMKIILLAASISPQRPGESAIDAEPGEQVFGSPRMGARHSGLRAAPDAAQW